MADTAPAIEKRAAVGRAPGSARGARGPSGGGRRPQAEANGTENGADTVVRGGRPSSGGGGRQGGGGGGRQGGGRTPRPAQRTGTGDESHMSRASVNDVAKSDNPVLKVKGDSRPNTVAGAICNIVRESTIAPSILATGPQAINQSMKAVAIARQILMEELSIDLIVTPKFEEGVGPRTGSNVCFELIRTDEIKRDPLEGDLSAKERTDVFKLGGAIAGRVRDGEVVNVTTKGPVPVLITVKAIAAAKGYVADDKFDLRFSPKLVELENPDIRDQTSTYLHFAVLAYAAA